MTVYNEQTARRYYRIDCPICETVRGEPDTGGHMHVFMDSWFCHCFRCGSHVHVTRVLEALGVTDIPRESRETIFQRVFNKVNPAPVEVLAPSEVELPDGCFRFPQNPSGIVWNRPLKQIRDWGLDLETVRTFDWRWNVQRDAFFFPVYFGGKIVYYTWRTMSRQRGSCPGEHARYGLLYNYECPLRDAVSDVYIVEGPRDTLIPYQQGIWAVGLHGHALSAEQELRLRALPHTKRFLLDSDVTMDSMALSKQTGWESIFLPTGDPSDYFTNLRQAITGGTSISARVQQLIKNKQVSQRPSHGPRIPPTR